MRHSDFTALLKDFQARQTKMLSSKSAEYSTEDDKLHNFKESCKLTRKTPEESLWGMAAKQITSVIDGVIRIKDSARSREFWLEKILDSVNYFVLLWALLHDRYQWEIPHEESSTEVPSDTKFVPTHLGIGIAD